MFEVLFSVTAVTAFGLEICWISVEHRGSDGQIVAYRFHAPVCTFRTLALNQ